MLKGKEQEVTGMVPLATFLGMSASLCLEGWRMRRRKPTHVQRQGLARVGRCGKMGKDSTANVKCT